VFLINYLKKTKKHLDLSIAIMDDNTMGWFVSIAIMTQTQSKPEVYFL